MAKISEEALSEWLNNPAAASLRRALEERIKWLTGERAGVFFPGEPARTQEAIIEIEARLTELWSVRSWLESSDHFRSETENAEHERVLPVRLPGTGSA